MDENDNFHDETQALKWSDRRRFEGAGLEQLQMWDAAEIR